MYRLLYIDINVYRWAIISMVLLVASGVGLALLRHHKRRCEGKVLHKIYLESLRRKEKGE